MPNRSNKGKRIEINIIKEVDFRFFKIEINIYTTRKGNFIIINLKK